MKLIIGVMLACLVVLLISAVYFFQYAIYYKPLRIGNDKAK